MVIDLINTAIQLPFITETYVYTCLSFELELQLLNSRLRPIEGLDIFCQPAI